MQVQLDSLVSIVYLRQHRCEVFNLLAPVVLSLPHLDSCLPVAYASRAISTVESCYAKIKKEALVIAWACEIFSS